MAGKSWTVMAEEATALVESLEFKLQAIAAELEDARKIRDIATAHSSVQSTLLRGESPPAGAPGKLPSPVLHLSQRGAAEAVLREFGRPLHVKDIIRLAEERHGVKMKKTSIVSTLAKLSKAKDTFAQTDKSTFGLLAWASTPPKPNGEGQPRFTRKGHRPSAAQPAAPAAAPKPKLTPEALERG